MPVGEIEQRLRKKIEQTFLPVHMTLENESHKHGFSRGPEGHFKLVVIAEIFGGLTRVERHQKIFAAVKTEFDDGIHALAIRALTPEEATKEGVEFETPVCGHRRDM